MDSEFQVVRKGKCRLSPEDAKRQHAWKKFRQIALPRLGKEYVIEEVRDYMQKHPRTASENDEVFAKREKDAENWAVKHWKRMCEDPLLETDLEIWLVQKEPRATKDAWKSFDFKEEEKEHKESEGTAARQTKIKAKRKTEKNVAPQVTQKNVFDALAGDDAT